MKIKDLLVGTFLFRSQNIKFIEEAKTGSVIKKQEVAKGYALIYAFFN
jgi:hypothetical protein